jgi:hypothetical protein
VQHRTTTDTCTWRRRRSANRRHGCTRGTTLATGSEQAGGGRADPVVGGLDVTELERRMLGAAVVTVIVSVVLALHGAW